MRGKLRSAVLLAGALACFTGSAVAQDPKAEADRLFQDGRRLLDAKQVDQACEALAKSDRLDPAIGTLGLLAACHEQQGRIGTAYREYEETARRAQSAGDPREAYARQRAEQLKATAPTLKITSLGHEPGLEVTRNGQPIRADELNQAGVVDPGSFVIIASAPGKTPYRVNVSVSSGTHAAIEIPALEGAAAGPGGAPPIGATSSERPPSSSKDTLRTAGFIAGGVGIAGIGVWAVTGLWGMAQKSSANEAGGCEDDGSNCDDPGKAAAVSPSNTALLNVATVGLVVGGVGLATGTVLLVLASQSGEAPATAEARLGRRQAKARAPLTVAPSAGPGAVGAVVSGAF